jgi:hypothetical protein
MKRVNQVEASRPAGAASFGADRLSVSRTAWMLAPHSVRMVVDDDVSLPLLFGPNHRDRRGAVRAGYLAWPGCSGFALGFPQKTIQIGASLAKTLSGECQSSCLPLEQRGAPAAVSQESCNPAG